MKKYVLLVAILVAVCGAAGGARSGQKSYTHTVMVEVGTATWCPYCHYTNQVMHAIYSSGQYDFEYAEMVTDKNTQAYNRMTQDYNQHYYPTSFFDGGHGIVVGGYQTWTPYTDALNSSGARNVPDIEANISALWLGNATINVSATIQNNEDSLYSGRARIFIIEIESRWNDYYGEKYHNAFLGFAINQNITIPAHSAISLNTIWNGTSAGYGNLTMNNTKVILAVYNSTPHPAYSDPPDNTYPFWAYYVDETVACYPTQYVEVPFNFSLLNGWNLISIPVGVNLTARDLVENISACNIVSRWDEINQSYKIYTQGMPEQYNFQLLPGNGYFAGLTSNENYSVVGMPITYVEVNLSIGWNLIGWFKDATNAKSLLQNITACNIVCKWDEINQSYKIYTQGMPEQYNFIINKGEGVFVSVEQQSTWHGEG